ncbi:MAG: hypothetical protein MUQ10_06890, partial [Anaerolineae bacterium]|nr:hypothetical protein [Anaerolineae bacterium]
MTSQPAGYRMFLAVTIATILLTGISALPVDAQTTPPDRRFGAVEACWDPVAAAEIGVGWERILLYWSELQPSGRDDWNPYHLPDEWLSNAAQANREVVGLLKHTPQWATDGIAGCGVPRGLYLPVDDPGNLWANFVRLVVEKYQGRIDHWIIWNEPDIAPTEYGAQWCGSVEDYYQLLKVAYLAAHEVNPNVTIHLAGLTYWHDQKYLQKFLAVATSDPGASENGYYFDVVSLHIYFKSETVSDVFRAIRGTLSTHGIQKPIWLNETNAATNSDSQWDYPDANYQIDPDEQASFLMQSFALALSQGAERIAVYKWRDQYFPPEGNEPNGIIRPDYSRLPAVDAYRTIVNNYSGTASAHADRQPEYTVVTLSRGTRTTRVMWARTEVEATITLPALAPQAMLIEQDGTERQVTPVDGQYTVTLPGARCADTRGCIIGGRTYLLVEEAAGDPAPSLPVNTPEPETSATPEASEVVTPTLSSAALPTATSEPTATPTPAPQPSPTPTHTPTSTPSPTSPPTNTPTPLPPTPAL